MKVSLLRKALKAANNGIVITDALKPDNPIIYINPAFEKMTGYSEKEVLGKNCRFLQGKDHRQKELDRLRSAIADSVPCTVTLRNYRKDGTKFFNELNVSQIRDRKGTVINFIGVQKDITDEILADRRAEKYRHRLHQANKKLKEIATHDPLTEIFNRRFFKDMYKRDWRIALRSQNKISILMLDVDYFKNYNDTYGHQAGDECLKKIAMVLKESLRRAGDIVARYGGEEFVIVLNDVSAKEALASANLIRKRIRALKIPHSTSKIAPIVSVSCGVATVTPKKEMSPEYLIQKADTALYKAKENGRNRVVSSK